MADFLCIQLANIVLSGVSFMWREEKYLIVWKTDPVEDIWFWSDPFGLILLEADG